MPNPLFSETPVACVCWLLAKQGRWDSVEATCTMNTKLRIRLAPKEAAFVDHQIARHENPVHRCVGQLHDKFRVGVGKKRRVPLAVSGIFSELAFGTIAQYRVTLRQEILQRVPSSNRGGVGVLHFRAWIIFRNGGVSFCGPYMTLMPFPCPGFDCAKRFGGEGEGEGFRV